MTDRCRCNYTPSRRARLQPLKKKIFFLKQFCSPRESLSSPRTHTQTQKQQHQRHLLHPPPHPTVLLPRPPGSAVFRHLQPREAGRLGEEGGGDSPTHLHLHLPLRPPPHHHHHAPAGQPGGCRPTQSQQTTAKTCEWETAGGHALGWCIAHAATRMAAAEE